jgi:predicted TIM-barrel fold metal-dependent hydrolase
MGAVPHRIDVHHHILPPAYVAALRRVGVTREGGVPLPHWNADRAVALMDRQGIATAVTSISAPGVYFGDPGLARDLARQCNEFSAGLIQAHPGRFGAFAVLPLPDTEAALVELRHALDILRLDGVVLLTSIDGRYLGDPLFDPLMAELDRRETPVFVHPTTPPGSTLTPNLPPYLVDYVFDTTKAVANLLLTGTLERFPRIPFILAHAGGAVPYLAWRLALALERQHVPVEDLAVHVYELATHRFARGPLDEGTRGFALLKRLYYDTALSATPYVFRSLLALVPPSHILFGTDVPYALEFLAAETVHGIAEEVVIDANARRAIERESALALFPRLRTAGEHSVAR